LADRIITIDGPAGSGKSTVARLVAERIDASFLDTGAMYRAVTLAAMEAGADLRSQEQLLDVLRNSRFEFTSEGSEMRVSIDGLDVTERIRQQDVTANAKYIASSVKLREKLVEMQRQFAAGQEKVVTEGRDQGTVAFSDAEKKFYLTADIAERARRRQYQLQAMGVEANLEEIQSAIEARDKSDIGRDVGPLKAASDAIIIDTTDLNVEEVVEKILDFVSKSG